MPELFSQEHKDFSWTLLAETWGCIWALAGAEGLEADLTITKAGKKKIHPERVVLGTCPGHLSALKEDGRCDHKNVNFCGGFLMALRDLVA